MTWTAIICIYLSIGLIGAIISCEAEMKANKEMDETLFEIAVVGLLLAVTWPIGVRNIIRDAKYLLKK